MYGDSRRTATNMFMARLVSSDATETVTAYVVFPEYYRSKAAPTVKLKARYDYIKTEIFGGVEFRNKALENQTLDDAYASTTGGLCWRVKEFRMDNIVVK